MHRRGWKQHSVAIALILLCSCEGAALPLTNVDRLRQRVVDAMAETGAQGQRVAAAAVRYTSSLDTVSGQWQDIQYTTNGTDGRSWWACGEHLQRMLLLATAVRSSDLAPDAASAVLGAAVSSASHWLSANYKNSNWWWNDFGTPRVVLKTLLLLGAHNGTAADARVRLLVQHPNTTAIAGRCGWAYTGCNLVWAATTHVLRALALGGGRDGRR